MAYDPSNIFAKILRNEVPCKKIAENDYALAFHDIFPKAPVHALVIPKGSYSDGFDFYRNATEQEVIGFSRLLADVIEKLSVEKQGFRLISNSGINGNQEVPHYHIHILGGKNLGPLVASA